MAVVVDRHDRLALTWVANENDVALGDSTADPALCDDLVGRLRRYFEGEDVAFEDIATPTGSPFHTKCWDACRSIPRGETRSYGELARMAGAGPDAARAAGQAMRRNPLPVVVPCHRVIAADGRLHGFSGSVDGAGTELSRKRRLLELEGALATELPLFGVRTLSPHTDASHEEGSSR